MEYRYDILYNVVEIVVTSIPYSTAKNGSRIINIVVICEAPSPCNRLLHHCQLYYCNGVRLICYMEKEPPVK